MTSLQEEQAWQKRWVLRKKYRGLDVFDQLIVNEFALPDRQIEREDSAAERIIRFAYHTVPYYRGLFDRLHLKPDALRGLTGLRHLPLLSKRNLYDHQEELLCSRMPEGERLLGWFSSSGTTGRPARVLQTVRSNEMFQLLSHRNWRWFRFDPLKKLAYIRLAGQLPRRRDGTVLDDGDVLHRPAWRYIGRFFHTGPAVYFNVTSPIEEQIAMLCRERPAYLLTYPETLEHLTFACKGFWPGAPFDGMFAISEQLTETMRERIERTFEAPVHQNYGLNEIGLVATRCKAGRYHVHTEHCLVEVVDDAGIPCAPGQNGRIIVTGLTNLAMPLLRYDTDDLAGAVERDCPCGRTLPAFGPVIGRYSRIAWLPAGTLARVAVLQEAVESSPDELAAGLRRFQIYQFRSGGFELRLACTDKPPAAFEARIRKRWEEAGLNRINLAFAYVDSISTGPGGKYQVFDSAYYPDHKPSREDGGEMP